jgi:hypothetical protein
MTLKENIIMKGRMGINVLVAVLLLLMAGCATLESAKHEYIMRGQVLEVNGDSAYLCIGSHDGAQVGQEFTVYRFVKVPNPYSRPGAQYSFKREETGRIKITVIVDEHMATAKVVRGEVKENDVVELNQ